MVEWDFCMDHDGKLFSCVYCVASDRTVVVCYRGWRNARELSRLWMISEPKLSGEGMCSRALVHTTPGVLRVEPTAEQPHVGSEGLRKLPSRPWMLPRARGHGPSGCCVACYFLTRWNKMTPECYLSDKLKPQQQTEDGNFLLYPFIYLDHIWVSLNSDGLFDRLLSDHHFKSFLCSHGWLSRTWMNENSPIS